MLKKIGLSIVSRLMEIQDYSSYFSHRSNLSNNKFIIFATGRSGTTLLTTLLDSHPQIKCDNEILQKFQLTKPKGVLFPAIYTKAQAIKNIPYTYGCHVKPYQIQQSLLNRFTSSEQSFTFCEEIILNLFKDNWKIIYLQRKNILRIAFSSLIGKQRQQWHNTDEYPLNRTSVLIDYKILVRQIKRNLEFHKQEIKIVSQIPHLQLIYEEDLFNKQQQEMTGKKVCEYLGLKYHPLSSSHKKVSSNNLADDVENYHELIEKLKETEYAKFIDFFYK